MSNVRPKIVVIVGPTASGKTSLSIDIAKHCDGEVISADSRQVYKGLDIGSGKVTFEEMAGIKHHLLDVADPMTVYTAVDFKRDATTAVKEILDRNKLPIVAGGTYFYTDLLLGRLSAPEVEPDPQLRETLEDLSNDDLFSKLEQLDPKRAATIDKDNPRRLVRAIEVATALGKVPETTVDDPYDALTLGIEIEKEQLYENIHRRLIERLETGMIDEVKKLLEQGVTHERLESLGLEYRYLSRYLRGLLTYEEMVDELETKIRQFSKRQMTWLKRDKSIVWVRPENREAIFRQVNDFLTH